MDEYEKQSKQLEAKEKDLKKFLDQASDLYAQMLFAQSEDYMVAAWKVGSQKRVTVRGASQRTPRSSTRSCSTRWVRFLKKKPNNYSFLKPWQEMVAGGGSEEDAKKLAKEFVAKVTEINTKRERLEKENEATLASVKGPSAFDKDEESKRIRSTRCRMARSVVSTPTRST